MNDGEFVKSDAYKKEIERITTLSLVAPDKKYFSLMLNKDTESMLLSFPKPVNIMIISPEEAQGLIAALGGMLQIVAENRIGIDITDTDTNIN